MNFWFMIVLTILAVGFTYVGQPMVPLSWVTAMTTLYLADKVWMSKSRMANK